METNQEFDRNVKAYVVCEKNHSWLALRIFEMLVLTVELGQICIKPVADKLMCKNPYGPRCM